MERDLIKVSVAGMVRFIKCFISSPAYCGPLAVRWALWLSLASKMLVFIISRLRHQKALYNSLASLSIPDRAATRWWSPCQSASLSYYGEYNPSENHSQHVARVTLLCQVSENLGTFVTAEESSRPWELQQAGQWWVRTEFRFPIEQLQRWQVWENVKEILFTSNQDRFFTNLFVQSFVHSFNSAKPTFTDDLLCICTKLGTQRWVSKAVWCFQAG